jgi:hypothetical protein
MTIIARLLLKEYFRVFIVHPKKIRDTGSILQVIIRENVVSGQIKRWPPKVSNTNRAGEKSER